MATQRELSKLNFEANASCTNHQEINSGSLQRIADACELMAKSHGQLISERDRYESWYKTKRAELEGLRRVNAALRGVITKREKRIVELEAEVARAREEALKGAV